jgi:hypothetical protein
MLLITKLILPDPPATERTLVQPLLQLMAPALMHCLQQQQQQQQGSATVVELGVQVTPQQAEQLKVTQGFLEMLFKAYPSGECALFTPLVLPHGTATGTVAQLPLTQQ